MSDRIVLKSLIARMPASSKVRGILAQEISRSSTASSRKAQVQFRPMTRSQASTYSGSVPFVEGHPPFIGLMQNVSPPSGLEGFSSVAIVGDREGVDVEYKNSEGYLVIYRMAGDFDLPEALRIAKKFAREISTGSIPSGVRKFYDER